VTEIWRRKRFPLDQGAKCLFEHFISWTFRNVQSTDENTQLWSHETCNSSVISIVIELINYFVNIVMLAAPVTNNSANYHLKVALCILIILCVLS
jgi:hypothetical protein